ncbi:ras-induced vulval development antagonist-domain-containing protein [Dichotomocladium elegans]|nr:ras-induced vulval development antagonist-domain-containing protein [Dichotomocladium elegans]
MPSSMSRSNSRHRSPSPFTRRERYRRRSPSQSPRRRYSRDRGRSSYHSRSDRYRSRSYERRRSPPPRTGRYYEEFNGEDIINGVEKVPNETFMEYRMRVRDSSTATIWAPSPEPPRRRSLTPEKPARSSKRSRRDVSDSEDDSSDSDDSDDHRRRRKRRSKKSKRSSSKKKRSRRSSKKKHRRSVTPSSSSSSESEGEKEEVAKVEVDPSQVELAEDMWVEKEVTIPDEDNTVVGPLMLPKDDMPDERAYGSALLPGEGSAMAAYVQQGKRIPRRGEIGLSGDKIADYESVGFVMSGSRHQRMNAVRLRKENQVISAEEKRLLLQHAQEQKVKHENEIISGFRELLDEKFNSSRGSGQ